MPSLYVSIPARLHGRPFDPRASGFAQVRKIRSWREAGFVPVSINTTEEHERFPGFRNALGQADVASIIVPERSRRVVCSIRGFLKAIEAHTSGGPVAITNADICLAGGADLATSVATLSPSRFRLGQRMDFPHLPTVHDADPRGSGTVNLNGFDFFACDAAALAAAAPFLSEKLALGLPFWDHLLALALMATGRSPLLLDPARIRHAAHPIRWSMREYCDLGLASARHLAAALAANPAAARACDWLPVYHAVLAPDRAVDRLDWLLRRLIQTGWSPPRLTVRKIGKLAPANFAFLLYSVIRETHNALHAPVATAHIRTTGRSCT